MTPSFRGLVVIMFSVWTPRCSPTVFLNRTLVLDVDTGVDDAISIALAVKLGAQVEAITVVAGNTAMENAYNNTLRVLRVLGRSDIPVIKGADRPFDGFWNDEKLFFGLDNFGNSAHIYQVGTSPTSDKVPASLHLLEIVRRKPGQLTLVQVAPLTNLATALLVDPDFTKDVKEIFIMGGNYKGEGNVLPGSEFNFYTDPEAANVVFQRALCPVTVVTLESTLDSTLCWATYDELAERNATLAGFFANITRHTRNCCTKGFLGYNVGDALAVMAALIPDFVVSSADLRVAVEVEGTYTKGQLVHATREHHLPHAKRTVTVVKKMDRSILSRTFKDLFV